MGGRRVDKRQNAIPADAEKKEAGEEGRSKPQSPRDIHP